MAARSSAPDIRAAGAVVWRRRGRGIEVALVHRPRYDDWTLPKGKLEKGETELAAAVREVGEEIGSTIAVSRRLERIRYDVGSSRKEVVYWLARHVSGRFEPNDEVDEIAWLGLTRAADRLSYDIEGAVLEDVRQLPAAEATLVLVRHAKAGKRGDWDGADVDRPLDSTGRRQAARLIDFGASFGPTRIVSAEPVRCRQTVEPLAERMGLDVEVDEALGDHGFEASQAHAEQALVGLAQPGSVTVVASQGKAIPGLMERVWPQHRTPDTRKGAAWVLSVVDGVVLAADHYPDASR